MSPAEMLVGLEEAEKRREEGYDRVLANGCQPMRPTVTWVADEDQVDGRSWLRGGPLQDSAERLVRNRLEIAGLYSPIYTPWYLMVNLRSVRGAFTVEVVFGLAGSGEPYKWNESVLVSTRTLGWPRDNDVLQVISERLDRFILRYRRANREACQ